MLAKGWTIQNSSGGLNEDDPNISVAVNPEYTGTHGQTVTNLFTPTFSGGTSPYTVTVVEVDGQTTSSLPTGFTLTSASTGEISLTTSTTAGTYTLGFRVTDSASPANHATYEVTVVLS
jgi:methionine-rich copper-binding protein CopC